MRSLLQALAIYVEQKSLAVQLGFLLDNPIIHGDPEYLVVWDDLAL